MRYKLTAAVACAVAATLTLTGCGSAGKVQDANTTSTDGSLVVYVGAGDDHAILKYVADNLLPKSLKLDLVDAAPDSDTKLATGKGDLAYYQHVPALEADQQKNSLTGLSVVSKVNVVPYALYSSKWRDLADTTSWVHVGLVADQVTGKSLPHGAQVVLPTTPTGYARGLYLLQSAGLLKLDRPFGGTSAADLTITQANVLDSSRHLSLLPLNYDDYLKSIYQNYDAVVLNPTDAASIGLDPARDALATEPGPDNPYAHVLVAPARLAGDQRVLELTHALESPRLAQFLSTTYHGADISVAPAATAK